MQSTAWTDRSPVQRASIPLRSCCTREVGWISCTRPPHLSLVSLAKRPPTTSAPSVGFGWCVVGSRPRDSPWHGPHSKIAYGIVLDPAVSPTDSHIAARVPALSSSCYSQIVAISPGALVHFDDHRSTTPSQFGCCGPPMRRRPSNSILLAELRDRGPPILLRVRCKLPS